jgi:hypothetical protein
VGGGRWGKIKKAVTGEGGGQPRYLGCYLMDGGQEALR